MSDYIKRTKSKVVVVFHFFDKDGSGELDAKVLQQVLSPLVGAVEHVLSEYPGFVCDRKQ